MPQITGRVRIPTGKNVAVNIGCDVDAQAIWIGSFNMLSPAYMSRGEFGAEVGVPRLLRLFDKHGVKATWCIPGHTVDTWPDMCREILAAGHEIAPSRLRTREPDADGAGRRNESDGNGPRITGSDWGEAAGVSFPLLGLQSEHPQRAGAVRVRVRQ